MEPNPVDLARSGLQHRRDGHAPILAADPDPSSQRNPTLEDSIQERECTGRKVDETLSRRYPNRALTERGDEGRVAIDDDVARTAAHAGGTPFGRVGVHGRVEVG